MPGNYTACLFSLVLIFIMAGCSESNRLSQKPQPISGSWTYRKGDLEIKTVRPLNDSIKILLNFNRDSLLSGHTGCNEFWGNYSVKGENITLYNLSMTRKMCEGITWEHELIQTLKNINGWKIRKNCLELETKDKVLLIWCK